MPIYEFRCRTCGKKTTALVLVRDRVGEVRCAACAGADLERLWSRFATVKSDDARMESLSDPSSLAGVDESDPKSMMRWMKRMGQEMGEDLGDDFEQAMEEELAGGGEQGPGAEASPVEGEGSGEDPASLTPGGDDL
jgi:putative FmdB family regulatory protein